MGKLIVTTFLTLDGVMQAPGGPEEDQSGGFTHGGWLVPYADADMGRIMDGLITQADAFLLGRKTYQIFASYWPRVTDPTNSAARMLNGQPKFVASTTLDKAEWQGTTVLKGNVVDDITKLKRQAGLQIQVHGSGGLAQTLIEHDLVDEYHLWVHPIVLGTGKRLFASGAVPAALTLLDTHTTSTGVTVQTYQRAGKPKYGTFALDQ